MESEQEAWSVHMSNDSPATPQLGNHPWAVCVPLATALTSLAVKCVPFWMVESGFKELIDKLIWLDFQHGEAFESMHEIEWTG